MDIINTIIVVAITSLISGVITGALSSVGTVKVLKVHLQYIKKELEKHETKLDNHSERLRSVEINHGKTQRKSATCISP